MTTERITHNKDIVDAFIQELFSKGDLDAVDRFLDPQFVDHDPPIPGVDGADGMRHAAAMFRHAMPDWRSEVELLVAEDDIVVEKFTASGTHRGALMGVEPTGRRVELAGINIFRVSGDRIVERWGRLDEAGLLRQLGLIPS